MKNIEKLVVVGCLVLLSATFVQAQSKTKIGHINSNELLVAMPERAEAEKALQAYAQQLETQLSTMSTEWESKMTEYQTNEKAMSELIRDTKVKEINDLEARIKAFQEKAQSDIQAKEGDLLQPIIEKARKAIELVAAENGYTYVLDSGVGVLLVQPESDNILSLVKKNLGIAE